LLEQLVCRKNGEKRPKQLLEMASAENSDLQLMHDRARIRTTVRFRGSGTVGRTLGASPRKMEVTGTARPCFSANDRAAR